MPTPAAPAKPCARDRLLAAADELFYAEGVQTVGIDRIIEHAGVAKASLYNTFGSKDELVRAYLDARHDRTKARLTSAMAAYDDPRDRLLAIFDAQARLFADPTFRGCAFANASAEARPGSAALEATESNRSWLRELFTDLAQQAGAEHPDALGRQLQLVYDGTSLSGRMDHDPETAEAARVAVGALIDAALV
jgi:AcrR family transcriptional regulator